jgi:DNA primase
LPQALRPIREAKRVLVVEGYMDVVALAQHGIEYAVATLGTATSGIHLQRLLRLSDEVIFCFDGDAAGRRAAWRALEVSLAHLVDGKQVGFLFLPERDDPDSYVRGQGAKAFETLLTAAVPLSTYLVGELSAAFDLKSEEGRAALLRRAKPLVQEIAAPMLSLMLRKRLADVAGITREELDRLFDIRRQSAPVAAPPKVGARPEKVPRAVQLSGYILALPRLARQFDADLLVDESAESGFLQALVEFCAGDPHITHLGQIHEQFRGTQYASNLTRASSWALSKTESLPGESELEMEFRDCLLKLQDDLRKEERRALIQRATTEGLSEELKRAVQQTGV